MKSNEIKLLDCTNKYRKEKQYTLRNKGTIRSFKEPLGSLKNSWGSSVGKRVLHNTKGSSQ